MLHVFKTHRLSQMIHTIIKQKYYYSNKDEIERIYELTHMLLNEQDKSWLLLENREEPQQMLFRLFLNNIAQRTTIHFDSIVNFGIQSFKELLTNYVGLAIDEFKREEEHQNYIHMLREFIRKRKTKVTEIHLLQGTPFTFFKANGKPYTPFELRKIMCAEPLYSVGLDENEMNLAPLIALLPKKIYIYGDHPSEARTLTIINVFQERVKFRPYAHFPFAKIY